jgi:hypothetical protein
LLRVLDGTAGEDHAGKRRQKVLLRTSANVTGDFGNVTDLEFGAGLRG